MFSNEFFLKTDGRFVATRLKPIATKRHSPRFLCFYRCPVCSVSKAVKNRAGGPFFFSKKHTSLMG
jgi:hypothetical protein